jgi:DnaJ family protein A protein 5
MGAEQSSNRSGGQATGVAVSKTCYYELLGVNRQATDDE